ncbi:MAG: hypothetical protein ABIH63_04375 [archaeon]
MEEKLNHQLIVRLPKWTMDELRNLAQRTGLPRSIIVRAFLNSALLQLKNVPTQNIIFKFESIKIGRNDNEP